jgi:lysozyme family protein
MDFSPAFNKAISHCMLYEVGGFWNEAHPAVAPGSIATAADRKAVGYVNDPADRGGETKFGVAKNGNPGLNITRLTWAQAKQVYYDKYWVAGKCHLLPAKIAIIHFDGCVNHGPGRAAKFLQEALGVTVDGAIGPKTLEKIKGAKEEEIVQHIARIRRSFYQGIVNRDKSQAKFLNGWLRRINEVENYAIK